MTKKPNDLQRLLAEEPFVRALAHSLVADEADDIVQQAFLQALQHQPANLQQPRSWLARIVRNLVVDHRRRHARRDSREQAVAPSDHVPSSSELLEGEDRRRALVAAVDRLPSEQRTVVLLRYYDGLPPRRIAAQLGLPVATVWNRLHAALQTLRSRLDAEHGNDRRAWLLPLVPFATLPRALPWREVALTSTTPALVMGVIAMTTKTKIVAAAAALLMLAVAWVAWPRDDRPGTRPPEQIASNAASAAQGEVLRTANAKVPAAAPQREAVATSPPATAAATTGTLLVHVRYADEPTVATGLTVLLSRQGGDFRVGVHRAVTDDQGTARFESVAPGAVLARAMIQSAPKRAEVRAGETAECTLQLQPGIELTGIVVDAAAVPIGGAVVEAGMPAISGMDTEQIAVTAADGTFAIRACYRLCVVGARAAGHAASALQLVRGKSGGAEHVRIVLSVPGGSIEGTVFGADDQPVGDAVVRIGTGRTEGILASMQGAAPLPAQVRTDANGRFVAVGVPVGQQPLQVRAAGFAPWSGMCEVAADLLVAVRVNLSPGVTCIGIVRGEDGEPAANVDVSVGEVGDFVLFRTRTAVDGTFTLAGLPISEFVLAAQKDPLGKASARLQGQSGETLRCDLRLSNGLALRGRVVDDLGAPVAEANVVCDAEGAERWSNVAISDKAGRFLIAGCPSGRRFHVSATAREHLSLERTGIDPLAGELELQLARDTAPKARIQGRMLRPDGSPATGESVVAIRYRPQLYEYVKVNSDGTFTIEVPSGEWHIAVDARNHPQLHEGPRSLQSGATWDLGTLQLAVGGTLVVRDRREGKLDYLVFDTRERLLCGLSTPEPPLRSELLAPGDYFLHARGDGIAAQVLPFTIRPTRDTEIEIRRPPGARQRFEFMAAAGAELERGVEFEVRRDGKLMLWASAEASKNGPPTTDVWLAPGPYSLATRNREPMSTASFTVGAAEGPPVRIVLR